MLILNNIVTCSDPRVIPEEFFNFSRLGSSFHLLWLIISLSCFRFGSYSPFTFTKLIIYDRSKCYPYRWRQKCGLHAYTASTGYCGQYRHCSCNSPHGCVNHCPLMLLIALQLHSCLTISIMNMKWSIDLLSSDCGGLNITDDEVRQRMFERNPEEAKKVPTTTAFGTFKKWASNSPAGVSHIPCHDYALHEILNNNNLTDLRP